MKTSQQIKKDEELKIARYFIDRLNEKFSLDYNLVSNNNETKGESDVDVYANSNSGREQLKLQITTNDGQILKDCADNRKEAERNGSGFAMSPVRDLNPIKLINEAIKNKKYSNPSDIILIVFSEFGSLVDKNWAKDNFPSLAQNNYKGIFWVRMPSNSERSSHPHNGQIVAIKNTFGVNGISF